MFLNALQITLLLFLLITGLLSSCEQPAAPPPSEEEPYFKTGEYGGEPLEGTEHLYNLQLSPNGSKIALIRSRTPDKSFEPRDQLWIVNADGTEPELIGYNIGTVDWSPDGQTLAITFIIGFHNTFVITFDVYNKDSIRIWTGLENKSLNMKTTSNPRWFSDGKRMLLSVWGKAYQQSYERGLYRLDTYDSLVDGPLVEVAAGGFLGNHDHHVIAKKFTIVSDPFSGNYIRFDFSTNELNWITKYPQDSLRWVENLRPNPEGSEVVYARQKNNAWQLYMMDLNGSNSYQLTKLGGNQLSWSKDGQYVFFNRDVHKASGARFIPHYYELITGGIEVLWPELPDSVPQFPPLETQNPIDFYTIVQDSSSNSN